MMLEKRAFNTNGRWVFPAEPNDFEVINPSMEEPCAVIPPGGNARSENFLPAKTVSNTRRANMLSA